VKQAGLAEAEAATDRTPTPAQIEAGNYRKGKLRWNGLEISIENPAGSVRRGVAADGTRWQTTLKNSYGYFRRTEGADTDSVDVFLGPHMDSELVFVVDQLRQGHTKKSGVEDVLVWPIACDGATDGREKIAARLVEASGVSDVERDARQVFQPQARALSLLRGEGNPCVRTLGRLQGIPAGYGTQAISRNVIGSHGSEQGLLPRELSMGVFGRAGAQQQKESTVPFPGQGQNTEGSVGNGGDELLHAQGACVLPGLEFGKSASDAYTARGKELESDFDTGDENATLGGLGARARDQSSHAQGQDESLGDGAGLAYTGEQEFGKGAKDSSDWWDEHKVIIGCRSKDEAVALYLSNYAKGWKLGPVSALTVPQLREWLKDGDTKKPLHGQMVKAASAATVGAGLGGLLGAIGGGVSAHLHNKDLPEDAAERRDVVLNALGFGAAGALAGGAVGALAGNVLGRAETGKPKGPFFPDGKPLRELEIPNWQSGEGGRIDPEKYLSHWYQHVDGGWARVLDTARQAVRRAKLRGDWRVAEPGSEGDAKFNGDTIEDSESFLDLMQPKRPSFRQPAMPPGPWTDVINDTVGGDYPDDDSSTFRYDMSDGRHSSLRPDATEADRRQVETINGMRTDDLDPNRQISQDDARSLLVGHEARHQFQGERTVLQPGHPAPSLRDSETYSANSWEASQALGQLKAETAWMTGQVIETSQDFRQLMHETGVDSPDVNKFREMQLKYSPEGSRMLNYMRTLWLKDPEAYDRAIKEMGQSDILRQVVMADPPEQSKVAAVGIPDRSDTGDLSKIKAGELLDWIIQEHQADRAGRHLDVRLGDKDKGLYSWATRKGMPEAGKPTALFRQPLHSHDYGEFEGEIPKGSYGAGTVRQQERGKALVTETGPEGLSIATDRGRWRLVAPKGDDDRWLVAKASPPPPRHVKTSMPQIDPAQFEEWLASQGEDVVGSPKIDGALQVLRFRNSKPELFSHRQSRRTGGPIEHTNRVFEVPPKLDVPAELRDHEFLGELYGLREGQVIPPQELGGLLNMGLTKALETKRGRGIKLRLALHGLDADLPHAEKRRLLAQVAALMPEHAEVVPEEHGPERVRALLGQIREGRHPLTGEGVVVAGRDGRQRKVKLRDEADVHVVDTFPGEGKFSDQPGGFIYSDQPGGTARGRVGTGMTDEVRRQLGDYVGRVARITHQGRFGSGAYRAPSLHSFHEDLPMAKAAAGPDLWAELSGSI